MKSFMGKKVLLTRSTHENHGLARMMANLDFQVESLPLIEISSTKSRAQMSNLALMMHEFDGFIFISVNAAIYGVSLLQHHKDVLKKGHQIIAVGPRTAKELNSVFTSVLCPQDGVGAQSLLTTNEMLNVQQRKFLILRGRNGNPWLGEELESRQAQVEYFDCYSRHRPRHLEKDLASLFSDTMFDVCFLHSAHAAINLVESSGRLGQKISNAAAIVGSQAIRDALLEYGWKGNIAVAKTPANTDMIKCLVASHVIN